VFAASGSGVKANAVRCITYCARNFRFTSLKIVEIHPVDERIRELCQKALTADEAEVPALFAELIGLLQEHSETMRFLAAKTLNRTRQEPHSSSSKIA
jgi:hypothetical protein